MRKTNDILVLASHFNSLLNLGSQSSVKYNMCRIWYSGDLLAYNGEIDNDHITIIIWPKIVHGHLQVTWVGTIQYLFSGNCYNAKGRPDKAEHSVELKNNNTKYLLQQFKMIWLQMITILFSTFLFGCTSGHKSLK
jgi:hypothetical protein